MMMLKGLHCECHYRLWSRYANGPIMITLWLN